MNYVLIPADKVTNNDVVVGGLYYIDTLKRDLIDTNACKLQPSLCERVVVDGHVYYTPLHFGVKATGTKTEFLRCTGCLNAIKLHLKQYFCYF